MVVVTTFSERSGNISNGNNNNDICCSQGFPREANTRRTKHINEITSVDEQTETQSRMCM